MKKKYTILFRGTWLIYLLFYCSLNTIGQSSAITLWKENAIGSIWNDSTNTVAYGKKDVNGYYKIFLSDSLGNNEQQLVFPGWDVNRHQWAEEWHPSGDYLFCYIEKAFYAPESGHTRIADDAIPGYGAYTDVWIVKRDGSAAWQLTDLPNNYDNGVIHGAISKDGLMFAWSQRIAAPVFLDMNLSAGAYEMKVADFTDGPTPSLSNIRTFKPEGLLALNELESISYDKTELTFYSTFESKNILATPAYKFDINTNQITRLTSESFAQAPTFNPSGSKIVYMTGQDCDIFPLEIQGADWWQMNTNGTNKQRITRMNVTKDPQSVNHYRLAGSISFLSDSVFFGGVMSEPLGLTGYTVKVKILSTIDENQVPELFVFPNPSSDLLSVHLYNIQEEEEIQFSNLLGQIIMTKTVSEVTQIDISTIPNGIYFLFLKSNPKVTTKFIKQ